jgi:TackOD1 domain-containing protein
LSNNRQTSEGESSRTNSDSNHISHNSKNLLLQIKDKKIAKIEPVFTQHLGFIYPDLGLDQDLQKQLDVLHQLELSGFVTSELSNSVLQCPDCHSTKFSTQLSCSVCKSTNVTKGAVLEHLLCGNIAFDTKYVSGEENVLVCPKCGKRLKAIGVDYARPGIFYKCLKCKALLPQTETTNTCLQCTRSWNQTELGELQLMRYQVDVESISKQFIEHNLLPLVAEKLFSSHGLKVESPGKIKGLSKMEHTFDLLVLHYESGEPILALDLFDNNKEDVRMAAIRILAFYAKTLDANHSASGVIKKILVTRSEVDDEANELASAYGITIIQPTGPDMVISLILSKLSAGLPQET